MCGLPLCMSVLVCVVHWHRMQLSVVAEVLPTLYGGGGERRGKEGSEYSYT